MPDTAPCQRCQREILATARSCPECNYKPAARGRTARRIVYLVGVVLTITVIGAVLGIPILLIAYYHGRKARRRKPTIDSPS